MTVGLSGQIKNVWPLVLSALSLCLAIFPAENDETILKCFLYRSNTSDAGTFLWEFFTHI